MPLNEFIEAAENVFKQGLALPFQYAFYVEISQKMSSKDHPICGACAIGAALLTGDEKSDKEFITNAMNWEFIATNVAREKFQLTNVEIEGIIDGFDGREQRPTFDNTDRAEKYDRAYKAANDLYLKFTHKKSEIYNRNET